MSGTKNLAAGMTVPLLAALVAGAGPKWELSDDSYMQLGVLGQFHASYTEGAEDEHDLYLRRARIILSGQIAERVKFFIETDNDNAGRNGTTDIETDIQDAFAELEWLPDHFLQGGLILLPFSFENAASAGSLLGLDYNLETLKFVDTFTWRDYGAVLRGAFWKRLAYRVGAFDGFDDVTTTKNPSAAVRGTGHLSLNLVGEAENGWFFSQERLQDKPYVAIGAGADYQEDATRIVSTNGAPDQIDDNQAFVLDVQSGFPVGSLYATINGGWYTWDNSTFDGDTAFLEAGLRMDVFQVTGKVSLQTPDEGDDVVDSTLGLHYYMHKHQARGGLEYRRGDSADQILIGFQFAL